MPFESARGARTARRLAGDARAGLWARGKARRAQRLFLRRRWRRLTVGLLVWLTVIAIAASFMPGDVLRGMIIGAGAVAGPFAMWMLVVQLTGTGSVMMGDVAEQWTAQELRPLTREGWRLINHFGLASDDIDHLLIGPGGVFLFETKWASDDWESAIGRDRQRRATEQAASNARRLNLWSPFRTAGLRAQPVVVLWGAEVPDLGKGHPSEPRQADGTVILPGSITRNWVRNRADSQIPAAAIEAVWPALLEQVARRDAREHDKSPLPTSAADLALRAIFSLVSALSAALVIGQVLQWTGSLLSTILAGLILAAVGAAATRWRPARWIAWAWTAGIALSLAGLLIALLSITLRQAS